MSPISTTIPVTASPVESNDPVFQDVQVDNEQFFEEIEKKIQTDEILSSDNIHAETRKELLKLVAEMRKTKFIQGVTEWTASEQRSFFTRIRDEITQTSVMFASRLRERLHDLIEHELWREINDDGKRIGVQDGAGNTILPTLADYQYFLRTSFLVEQNTSIVPINLHLTIDQNDTVDDAKRKFDLYSNKYNALIIIDSSKRPIGMITRDSIEQSAHDSSESLSNIPMIPNIAGSYMTSRAEAERIMQENGINVLPIVDSKTNVLIGVLTIDSLVRREAQYYSTVSLTELSLDYLKNTNKAPV